MKKIAIVLLAVFLFVACAAGGESHTLSVNGKDIFIYYGQVLFKDNYVVLPFQRVLDGLGAERIGIKDSKKSKEVLFINDYYFIADNNNKKLYLVDQAQYNAIGSSLYNLMLDENLVLSAPFEDDTHFASWQNGILLDQNTLTDVLNRIGIDVIISVNAKEQTVSVVSDLCQD